MYVYIYIYTYTCYIIIIISSIVVVAVVIHIYIYIHRERDVCMHIYIYIYIYVHTLKYALRPRACANTLGWSRSEPVPGQARIATAPDRKQETDVYSTHYYRRVLHRRSMRRACASRARPERTLWVSLSLSLSLSMCIYI